jgi:hypothetical protein
MTAGHNALRGSGPGQKLAFDDAMALVGCPNRRIDRLCITCVRPPNLHITPEVGAISFTRPAQRVACNARPWPSWPGHARNLVGKCNGGDLGRTPCQ